MTYIYGAVQTGNGKGVRAYIDYTLSSTETTYTITVKCGFQAYSQAVSDSDFPTTYPMIAFGNSNSSYLECRQIYPTDFSVAKGAYYQVHSVSHTFSKTTTSQTVTLNYYAGAGGGASAPAQASWTIPALKSYAVSYNASGGTGAPAAQTKYYGKTLTLTTTKPTKSGYKFVKWNTKADGTGTSYNSGGSYTANAVVTLYAIWEWIYIPVKISNLVAQRCTSAGVIDDSGTYAKVTFNWTKGIEESGAVNPSSIRVGYKLITESSYTFTNVSDHTSGTVSVVIGGGNLSNDNTYDVEVIIATSGRPDVTSFTYISTSYFCIDVSPDGKAIGFGRAAPENKNGFFCGMDPYVDVNTTAASTTTDGKLTAALTALGWLSSVIQNKQLDIKTLLYKMLNIRIVEVVSDTFSINANGYLHLVVPLPSSGKAIAVVGWYITGTTNVWGNIYEYTLTSSGGDFRIKNLNQEAAMSCQLTVRYLVIG